MSKAILIYYIIICLGIIVGSIRYRNITLTFKLLTVVLSITIVTEMVALYLEKLAFSNLPVYHVFQILEFCLVAFIYKFSLKNNNIKKAIGVSIWLYPLIMIGFTLFLQPLKVYPSYSLMLSYSTLIVFSLIGFYQFINSETNYLKNYFFWLNVLYFVLCSVSIFTLSLTNLFNMSQKSNYIVYILHLVVNYIFYAGALSLLVINKKSLNINE